MLIIEGIFLNIRMAKRGRLLCEYVGPWKGPYEYCAELSWRGRLGVRLHQSTETECRQMQRKQWLPGWSVGCWRGVTSYPMWVSSASMGRLREGSVARPSELTAVKTEWAAVLLRAAFARCGDIPMRSDGDVYSLIVGGQLVPNKLCGRVFMR